MVRLVLIIRKKVRSDIYHTFSIHSAVSIHVSVIVAYSKYFSILHSLLLFLLFKMESPFRFVVLWMIFCATARCTVMDMATMEEVDYTWIESGVTSASSDAWSYVETSSSDFQHPVILLRYTTLIHLVTLNKRQRCHDK